jgi:hypothetical protein
MSISLSSMESAGAAGHKDQQPIDVRVALSHATVVAGTPIKGTVAFENTTRRRITVNFCAADRWLEIGLRSKTYIPTWFHAAVMCAPSVHLLSGINRFPVTVLTRYGACLQPNGQSLVPIPSCLNGNTPPPLPAGNYLTMVSISGLGHLTTSPPPVHVTLVSPSSRS